jgi:hypothetical protein
VAVCVPGSRFHIPADALDRGSARQFGFPWTLRLAAEIRADHLRHQVLAIFPIGELEVQAGG